MDIFNIGSFNSESNRIDSFDNLNDETEELYFNNYNFNKGIEEDLKTANNTLFFVETSITSNNILSPVGLKFIKNINEMNPPNINNNLEDEKIQKDKYIFTNKKRKSIDKNEESLIFKKCGRKTKESKETGFHNKYSDDNITRKIKSKTFKKIINYINSIINNQKGKLLYLSSDQVKQSKVDYNKKLLNKTLKDILSYNISGKYTNYKPQHNKYIIEELLKEDEEKRIFYKSLLNLTLLDCINHLRGDIFIKELKGLGTLDDMIHDLSEGIKYKQMFRYYFLNFETKINEKKGRNRKNLK